MKVYLNQLIELVGNREAVDKCCRWLMTWMVDIDETPGLVECWARYDPSGMISKQSATSKTTPIIFQSERINVGIALVTEDDDDCRLKIRDFSNDGTASIYRESLSEFDDNCCRHVSLTKEVTDTARRFQQYDCAGGLECGLNKDQCTIEIRCSPNTEWLRISLADHISDFLLIKDRKGIPTVDDDELDSGLNFHEELEVPCPETAFVEIEKVSVTGPKSVSCIVTLVFGQSVTEYIATIAIDLISVPKIHFFKLKGGPWELISGSEGQLILKDMGDSSQCKYVVDSVTGEFFPGKRRFREAKCFPVNDCVSLVFWDPRYRHGSSTASIHHLGNLVEPIECEMPMYLGDTFAVNVEEFPVFRLYSKLFRCGRYHIMTTTGTFQYRGKFLTGVDCRESSTVPLNGWVLHCRQLGDFLVVAYLSGRIEIRNKLKPDIIWAVAFVHFSAGTPKDLYISDLKGFQNDSEAWLYVAADQIYRFNLTNIAKEATQSTHWRQGSIRPMCDLAHYFTRNNYLE